MIALTKQQLGLYPAFFETYIRQLPEEADVFELLVQQPAVLKELLQDIFEAAAERGYAPGKWSVKELVGHIIDTERIMAYRCLCISRSEQQSLPGFDESSYIQHGNYNTRTLASLLEEYNYVRKATIALYAGMNDEMLNRVGLANQAAVSAKALIGIIAGHERHHLKILAERYLNRTI